MGRIKKIATERHTATASPYVSDFVRQATSTPLHQLPAKLNNFPQHWPFPRGDIYHWIPLLDRFDHLLELFNKEYGLERGPQQDQFQCRLLKKGDGEEGMPYPTAGAPEEELAERRYSAEGDREVIESVIDFTRILLEHCGNRSLYASSGHLSDMLHTTSLSLLRLCLRLSLRLAQRYQVARYKNHHPSAHAALLASHYNFNFERLHKIAQPFPKPPQPAAVASSTPGKGKDKASQSPTFNPSDLVAIAKEPISVTSKAGVASVHLTFYDQQTTSTTAPPSASKLGPALQPSEASPDTPTPVRRTSTLGPSRSRPPIGERSLTDGSAISTSTKSRDLESAPSSAPTTYQVSPAKVSETPAWVLVREALAKVPPESAYDVLNRVRIAKAFATPEESSQELLSIRLLAIANLGYSLGESKFQERVGIPDSEEPKRFHLAQQLCDLLQPATGDQKALSLNMETVVLQTIEALSKSRHKALEVSDALQISQNHGILYYELRRVIATFSAKEHSNKKLELQETEWREATFDLTNSLLQSMTQARHGERMVSAGIMAILIDALGLRTNRAERFHEKVLGFFDSFIHGIATAFQTLADAKGLDVLADLMSYEVTTSLQRAKEGQGLPSDFKSKVVDYEIPFQQQSTLRQLFKFTVHMFEHNAGSNDRLLRNLIDTPQVLGALRNVVENANVFGSNVWSGAVNIMSSFIHNEPTSFQVVSEAGLVKSLLQTIVPWEIKDTEEDDTSLHDMPTGLEYKDGELQYPTPSGILPVGETMCDIPTAFGAVCLNESGMKFFQSSKALLRFMDIFVSPPHVRALEEEGQTASAIGQAFDELSRHHPQLKDQIMFTVVTMVKRVDEVSSYLGQRKGSGSKLWERTPSGIAVAGGQKALKGPFAQSQDDGQLSAPVTAEDLGADDKERVTGVSFISACFKFLEGFFHNSGMCSYFCEQGGAELLLNLATSPSNPYDLASFPLYNKIAHVLKAMCDAKPHLVLPSLIRRTQMSIDNLKPMMESSDSSGAFASFMDLSSPKIPSLTDPDGTIVVKSLTSAHLMTSILARVFSPPSYAGRHNSQGNQLFSILNFTDVYIELVDTLSKLHSACVWERTALQERLTENMNQQSDPKPYMMRRVDQHGAVELAAEVRQAEQQSRTEDKNSNTKPDSTVREEGFALRNAKTVRYLLSQVPIGIEEFFGKLGQALVPKRTSDAASKQHGFVVADHLAKALVWQLSYRKFDSTDKGLQSKYLVQVLGTCTRSMLKGSRDPDPYGGKEALTAVLTRFYIAKGFDKLNEILQQSCDVIAKSSSEGLVPAPCNARDMLSIILGFYNNCVRSKCITDAAQSSAIAVRDHKLADYFMPGQFLVEVREAVLPAISKLWHSSALESIGVDHAKTIIEVLRVILKGDGEDRALSRESKSTRRKQATEPEFRLKSNIGLDTLKSAGADERLARQALYRCNNHQTNSTEYCILRLKSGNAPSFPIPAGEAPEAESAPQQQTGGEPSSDAPDASALERQRSVDMTDAPQPPADGPRPQTTESESNDNQDTASSTDPDAMSDDEGMRSGNLPAGDPDLVSMVGGSGRLQAITSMTAGAGSLDATPSEDTGELYVTLDDLNDKRHELRDDLIDRCLEILSAQPNITFELADLIQAAVARTGEGASPQADIGRTLVSSLLSLQGEEPSEQSGRKIAAYAHLVALILQNGDFFDSTLDELKESFDALVQWVSLGGEQKAEDAPWIEMILLIIERVLAHDEQPPLIEWQPPPLDDPLKPLPEISLPEPVVPLELRSTLFGALIDLIPKIGKSTPLALSVCRVMVILTRRRDLALQLSDKHTMPRLFVMVRQLAGPIDSKLQASFMMILRHMVEDERILRQIMQTEIRSMFENSRTPRAMDTATFTRSAYHLVLRDPQLFVDVSKEMLEIPHFDVQPARAQSLALKKEKPADAKTQKDEPKTDAVKKDKTSDEQREKDEAAAQPSVESGSADAPKPAEVKPPAVESPDGVVSFLLRELSNYKDVEEKPAPASASKEAQSSSTEPAKDVEMSDASTRSAVTPTPAPAAPAATSTEATNLEKPVFKADEHVIYIYRCFIMQCLAELLASYGRTKIEFINFSRKSETQSATPSKPRSGTLNYLLNMLIPAGTLEHRDDIAHRKKLSTSHWATTVLVSLCSRTLERQSHRSSVNKADEDTDLTFVRKFVLEHAIRSFKEANASSEPLDLRYSRLLALGELFNRMLSNKAERSSSANSEAVSARHVGKLMYEKNVVGALTSAIAEIDLNFPNAKRAVKYVLGPLKLLTNLGVTLSQEGELSSSAMGSTDDDEISSATSISDDNDDDGREETPDLYRNSTLGMFESNGGRDDGSESDSEDDEDDEDMYEEGYDEEMDYEEEGVPEHGDVVSDEDDEIEGVDGMGEVEGVPGDDNMDIEIVMNGGDEGQSASSEDEDASDDDDEDDDDDAEDFDHHMDEITGDDENASMADHDEENDWEEDDEIDAFDGEQVGGSPQGGPLDHIARVIGADTSDPDGGDDMDRLAMGTHDEEYFDDEMPPEEEDDEEDEVDYENDVVYEPEYEDEEGHEMRWDWDVPPPANMLRGHHHHHRQGMNDVFGLIGGEGLRGGPGFRSHRPGQPGRPDDDGMNPLLQRGGAMGANNREGEIAMEGGFPRLGRRTMMQGAQDTFLQEIVRRIGPNAGGTVNVNIEPGFPGFPGGRLPPMFAVQGQHGGHALIDIDPTRPLRDQMGAMAYPEWAPSGQRSHEPRGSGNDEAFAVEFRAQPTVQRWQEEARVLFGAKHNDKASRVDRILLRALVPLAMEAKRQHDKAEAERKEAEEKAREEERKKAEAERIEREAQEKKEREEREAKEAEEARARAQAQREASSVEGQPASVAGEGTSMEGIESQPAAAEGQADIDAAESQQPRVTTTIRGRELDITTLGIDLEYLDALPEDIREEVIMSQYAEQRSQAAQSAPTGEQPSEISREFLDALPPDMQRELLRQEAADRRRREQEEARRRQAQGGTAPPARVPEEMGNADFMAMLDPGLRQAILMDSDENTLAALPEDIQSEARTLLGPRVVRAGNEQPFVPAGRDPEGRIYRTGAGPREDVIAREARQRRPVMQMLDKAGIATLLRLMFVSLHHKAKTNLHGVLSDLCKNSQNRAEVISILLSILQDGTADVNAVERNFAALSLRAKQLGGPKTPQPLKRTATGSMITQNAELSPLNIVQQCLGTLNALVVDNPKVPSFFLSEHETITSQKTKSNKKGKARESRAAKFPLNALLTLLDRKLITENTGVMETLASLLSRVTQPLQILIKRAAEGAKQAEAEKKQSEAAPAEAAPTESGDVQMQESTGAEAPAAQPAPAEGPETAGEPSTTEDKEANDTEASATDDKKKHRDLTPPEIPEDNIRLVVNIITARECPSKTFTDTLDIIKHLSTMPDAKAVFGKELARQAQELSQAVMVDLDDLSKQIIAAATGTDLQGMALANFSSAASQQHKLLRILVALDHLFDPQRMPEALSVGDAGPIAPKLKEDILASLYESPTFDKLWKNLSECLTAIREKGNMVNVAAILLPVIESLMVVCRNTTLKDSAPEVGSPQQATVSSPLPESRMESLFFSFTDEHRKILNEIIRNNPKLMNGNLSVLANNSKVLEFDNKRNYFNRKVHERPKDMNRVSHPSLQLNIRRDHVFHDSFKSLYYKNGNEIKYGKLNIRFHGEEGIDAGGVSREWFGAMARQMFNPDFALFNPVASDRTTFHPNPLSQVNDEHLMFFKFIGRIIGKALYEGRLLDCHFSRAVYRRILGKSVSLKDMESLDLDYYKSLVWMLENDITDIAFETFSVDIDRFGAIETVDLCENGRNIPVTEQNKQDYVRLVVEHRLVKSVEEQLEHFLSGFHDIISQDLVSIFNEQELELLISGLPDIDLDDWKNNTEYHNYQATSPQIQWFWRAVRSFDKEEKAKLLQFITGTSKVPLNGFKELEGMNGFAKFNIHRDYSSKEKLPTSHTCFNQLDLPEYESYEHLRQQLYTAVTAGNEYFGFA